MFDETKTPTVTLDALGLLQVFLPGTVTVGIGDRKAAPATGLAVGPQAGGAAADNHDIGGSVIRPSAGSAASGSDTPIAERLAVILTSSTVTTQANALHPRTDSSAFHSLGQFGDEQSSYVVAVDAANANWTALTSAPTLMTDSGGGAIPAAASSQKPATPAAADPAAASANSAAASAAVSPALSISFPGNNYSTNGAGKPSTSLAAGPFNLVTVEDSRIQWYTKSGQLQNDQTLNSFFNLPSSVTMFNPWIVYDTVNQRFVVESDEANNGSSSIGIAVSKDSNPADGWNLQTINANLTINGQSSWADIPILATDGHAIYLTAVMRSTQPYPFPNGNDPIEEEHLWIINDGVGTGGIYDGGSSAVTSFSASAVTGSTYTYFGEPAQILSPTSGPIGTFLVNPTGNGNSIQIIEIDNATTSPSFQTQYVFGAPSAGSFSLMASQPGTSTPIDFTAIGNSVWQNGNLYAVSTIQPTSGPDTGVPTVQWEQINASNLSDLSLVDQGNISGSAMGDGAGVATYLGSISADPAGDFVINFNASGPNLYAGAYYAMHAANSAPGTIEAAQPLHVGQASFALIGNIEPSVGFGDYSSTALDPSDQDMFWGFNEYAAQTTSGQTGNWGTEIGAVSPSLSAPPPSATTGVVFQTAGTGDTGYWPLTGGLSAGWLDLGGSNPAYQAVGTGKFYGDGTSDILFQNTADGDTGFWKMSNGLNAGWVDLGGSNAAYHVEATDDLLGTGTSDIVFENINSGDTGYWNMSNGQSLGWTDLGGSNAAYHVVGTGDFGGNGVNEILFQSANSGDAGYWSMQGGLATGWIDLGGSNPAYHVVGTGDFNGDGTTDILFENTSTGDTGYWEMKNGASFGFDDLGGSNSAFHVIATGDFAGDGATDIMFENINSGDVGYWRMSGGQSVGWVDLGGSNAAYHGVGAITIGP
jgi:hypothetical protein